MNHFKILFVLVSATTTSFWNSRPAHAFLAPATSAQIPEEKERQKRFEALLKNKAQPPVAGQPSVAEQILPFLDDSFYDLRLRAVQALGELEDPIAKEPLEKKLAQVKDLRTLNEIWIPVMPINLSLGRISSRGLHGKAKVEAALSRFDLKWADLVALSQKTSAVPENARRMPFSEDDIVDFAVALLYDMRKAGEDIGPLAEQLALLPTQKAYVQAASLDNQEAVELLLRVLVDGNAIGRGSIRLIHLFSKLQPEASHAVLLRLQDMKAHPDLYYGTYPSPGTTNLFETRIRYMPLLRAASWTRDPIMIPLLREFEQCNEPDVRRSAKQARESIERNNS